MTVPVKRIEKRRSLRDNLALLVEFRQLFVNWTVREIKARYRQSALGFGWALIQPVSQMIIMTIIFGTLLRIPSGDAPYPIFAYVALLPWTLFSGSINGAVPSLIQNMQLITKIYFPREILPLSAAVSRTLDFFVGSIVLVALALWYGISPHPSLLYIPLLLLIQTTLAMAVSLLASAVSVFLRDISFAIPLGMQIWMYLSPVIYPLSQVPERWRSVYLLNPMAGVIDSYRRVVLDGTAPDPGVLASSAAISITFLVVSYWYFKRLEMAMADII